MAEKNEQRAEGILGDFSFSQVIATGLAAATSFALSAQIGIAGSIIGAVLGAVASSAATQVYRSILSASAEKIRALGTDGSAGVADVTREIGSISGRARVEELADSGTPIAPQEVIDAAREHTQARLRRRVAIIAAAAGIAVVLVFALAVNMATDGEGIGRTAVVPDASNETVNEQQVDAGQEAPASDADETDEGQTDGTESDLAEGEPSEGDTPNENPDSTVPEQGAGDTSQNQDGEQGSASSDGSADGSAESPEPTPPNGTTTQPQPQSPAQAPDQTSR